MNTRKMTAQSVKSIMQNRILIPEQAIGKRVVLTIQGNGTVLDVKNAKGEFVPSAADPNLVLQKKIFNFKANSGLAMSSDRNKQLLRDALAAEKAGDEKAEGLFNEYLNRVQLTAGILLPNSIVDKLSTGVEIAATIVKVTTENGSLLTIDASTISVVEPDRYGKTTFSLEDFASDEDEDSTSVQLALLDRAGLVAHIKANNLEVKVTKAMSDEQIRQAIEAVASEV